MLDLIMCANFGMEKLMGLGNTRGQILEFPIEMADHPYNSAALPRSLWYSDLLAKNWKFCQPLSHLAPSFGVTSFEFMEKLYGFWN